MKRSISNIGEILNKAKQKTINGGINILFCNTDEDCPSCENTGCPIESIVCYTCIFNTCIGNC